MAKQTKKQWHKLGAIWKNDEGRLSIAIPLAEEVTLKLRKGDKVVNVTLTPNDKGNVYLWLQKPEDELTALVANNVITEAEGEAKKAALPVGLRYQVVLPPPRD